MLRKIRIILAVLFFTGITLLLVGIGREWWGWMAKLQFLPSCLALNFAVIAGVLLLTLAFGRIYCSVICPMGVFQDIVMWIRREGGLQLNKIKTRKLKKLKAQGETDLPKLKPYVKHFSYVKENRWARYGVLALTVAAIIAGLQVFVALIAPYSAYGRIVSSIFGVASGRSVAPVMLIVAGVTLVLIFICAWFWGRAWCNTICPVGTFLGLFSRFALFRPVFDVAKCNACGRCYRGCKSSCIDGDHHCIDYSRCVVCFDCLRRCKQGAIHYEFVGFKGPRINAGDAPKPEPQAESVDKGRRAFMATTAVLATGIAAEAQNKHLDGGLAPVIAKTPVKRSERLVPFGALGVKDFYDRCTACQLCVDNCPNGVLRPSTDLEHLLQPQMGYENGWCRPECTACSQVCPAGAIKPISREEKATMKIGTAKVNAVSCIGCGNCVRHCPSGALRMVRDNEGKQVVTVAEEQCIGCGACEYLCPVRPVSAIIVNGISTHQSK